MSKAKLKREIKDMEDDLEGTLTVLFMMSSKIPRCRMMYQKVRGYADWDDYSKLSDLWERRQWLQSVLHTIQADMMADIVDDK